MAMDGGTDPRLPLLPGARVARDPARAIKRGPSRVPPDVVAANQRERLFDGLVQMVAQKGYPNARVGDICQAAGVTRPAFYAHFEGKEDAFLAAYRHGTGVMLGLMAAAFHGAGDWRTGVRNALDVLLTVLASVPPFACMAIVEIDGVGTAARRERDRMLSSFRQFFVTAPRRDQLPDELVESVIGGIYVSIYRQVAAGRTESLRDLLPTLTYFALVPFLGHEESVSELRPSPESPATALPCGATVPMPGAGSA
jgi:AcrR family transcriptional regulator